MQSQAELHLSRREKNSGEGQERLFFVRTASVLPKLKQKTKMRRVASLVSSLQRLKLHGSHHFFLEWRIPSCDEARDVTVFFFRRCIRSVCSCSSHSCWWLQQQQQQQHQQQREQLQQQQLQQPRQQHQLWHQSLSLLLVPTRRARGPSTSSWPASASPTSTTPSPSILLPSFQTRACTTYGSTWCTRRKKKMMMMRLMTMQRRPPRSQRQLLQHSAGNS